MAAFDRDEGLRTSRLRLSTLAPKALDSLAWLEAALAPDWRLVDLRASVEAGDGVLLADSERTPIGVAIVQRDRPLAGAACIPFIGIEPARRYRGLGGEAALALEQQLRARADVDTVYAPVPDGRGLAVYFWLRLGYHPLTGAEAPWPLVGLTSVSGPGIWLVRDAE